MWWNDYPDDFGEEQQSTLPLKEIIRRVYPYIRPHRWIFLLSFVLALGGVAFFLLQPIILKEIIDVDIPSGEFSGVLGSGLLYLLTMAVSSVTGFFSAWLLQTAGVRAVNDIKQKLFDHLLALGLPFLEQHPVGKLVSRIESDTQRLISLTSTMIQRVVMSTFMLLGAVVILATVNWRLFLLAVAIIPAVIVGVFLLFKILRPYFRRERGLYAEVSSVVAEFMRSASLLQLFDRTSWARDRMRRRNRDYTRFSSRLSLVEGGIFRGLIFLEVLVTVIALWLGAGWVEREVITIGSLVLFAQYIAQIYWPIIMLSDQLGEIQRAGGAADRIFGAFDLAPELASPAAPKPLPERIESLVFEDVSFSYTEDAEVLSHIDFELAGGESVALVGPTGGGKTTIVNLLCRLRDPNSGRILLNGVDIREYDLLAYRRLFGLVLQDLYLFPASVRDNLRAFRSDVPERAVTEACRIVGTDSILAERGGDLDTVLAEGGKDLSYGQRQLMAFARALTVDPAVLVLDEATSSVDPGTEQRIRRALDALLEGRTNLIVAHRLSTIEKTDRILVVEGGRIVERGTHAELMDAAGSYHELIVMQNGREVAG